MAWSAIHDAAAELALEKGPGATTIEAIAERAGVSRRTFFNYFAAKEDAILGMSTPSLNEDAMREFRAGDEPLLHRVALLRVAVVRTMLGDAKVYRRRRDVLASFPELEDRLLARTEVQVDETVVPFLVEELAGTDIVAAADAATVARILLVNARSIVRLAYRISPDTLEDDDLTAVSEAFGVHRLALQACL